MNELLCTAWLGVSAWLRGGEREPGMYEARLLRPVPVAAWDLLASAGCVLARLTSAACRKRVQYGWLPTVCLRCTAAYRSHAQDAHALSDIRYGVVTICQTQRSFCFPSYACRIVDSCVCSNLR